MCSPSLELRLVAASKAFSGSDKEEQEKPKSNRGPLMVTHVTGQNAAYDGKYVHQVP